MKRKQFAKGMNQIAQEGAIQIFTEPGGGLERVYVGVVGVLQFDVLELGRVACQTLLNRIEGKEVEKRNLLGYEISLKESTK